MVENNTPIKQAFLIADSALLQSVQGISDLITEPGEINIDFADVKTIMKGKGDALIGLGFGEGANRAVDAAKLAISNPLLENASIEGAKSVLVNLAGGDNLTLQEYQDVVELITANCAEDALIIAGQSYNQSLGDRIKVTVVATGFEMKPEVKTEFNPDTEVFRRKPEEEAPQKATAKEPEPEPIPEKKTPQEKQSADPAAITVNRWQDLQQQLGKRTQASNDYSIPAVLRYSRHDDDDR